MFEAAAVVGDGAGVDFELRLLQAAQGLAYATLSAAFSQYRKAIMERTERPERASD